MGNRRAPAGTVRRALSEDIEALVGVCRRSFPTSLRWQCVPRAAQQWWRRVLATPAAETYVFESDQHVNAFCVLVVDAGLWAGEKASRRSPISSTVLSALLHPTIVAGRIWRRLAAAFQHTNHQPVAAMSAWPPPRSWIELIAVDPMMRGCGVARMLLEACEARTVELGGAVIGLSADADGVHAIRLYEAAGYRIRSATRSTRIYWKNLVCPSLSGADSPVDVKDLSSDCEGGS